MGFGLYEKGKYGVIGSVNRLINSIILTCSFQNELKSNIKLYSQGKILQGHIYLRVKK